jgi:hypothetical protein
VTCAFYSTLRQGERLIKAESLIGPIMLAD